MYPQNLKYDSPADSSPVEAFVGKNKVPELTGKPSRYLYIAAASCLLAGVSSGMSSGYTALAGPKMMLQSSRVRLDAEDYMWFGSIGTLGALVGAFAGGSVSHTFGRKATLIFGGTLPCLGWIFISFGASFEVLLIGRIFCGLFGGLVAVVVPQYLVEISTVEVRGFIGCFYEMSSCMGILLSAVIMTGFDISWSWLAIVSSVPVIVMMGAMALMPESPRWLIQKGFINEAVKSTLFLHGNLDETEDELLEALKHSETKTFDYGRFQLGLLKQREYYLPYIYTMTLVFLQQLSGTHAISSYTVQIFQMSGANISALQSTIILDAICLVSVFFGSLLMDKCGRRSLLLISCAGNALGLCTMGLFYYFQRNLGSFFTNNYGWLGVTALSSASAFYAVGFGPVPLMILNEIVPQRAKGFVGSSVIALSCVTAFAISKTFNSMTQAMGLDGVFHFYGACSALALVFTWICIPETKGKTFAELSRHFSLIEDDDCSTEDVYKKIPPQIYISLE